MVIQKQFQQQTGAVVFENPGLGVAAGMEKFATEEARYKYLRGNPDV